MDIALLAAVADAVPGIVAYLGRAEDQALLYAIGSNKPIINVDPYTLAVKLFRDNFH